MSPRIAVHSSHEAAAKLGGIGTVLQGLLGQAAYQAAFPHTLLAGVYHFPAAGSVIDDEKVRLSLGWEVHFDSRRSVASQPLHHHLAAVAEEHGTRLVYGERGVTGPARARVLLAGPQGTERGPLDRFRDAVRRNEGVDLSVYDHYPAITDRRDRALARLLQPGSGIPDEPERLVLDPDGQALPGGARWVDGRAVFPPLRALDSFEGFEAANKYLIELQCHTFVAPVLWAAARAVLAELAPANGGYDPEQVALFAHDWLGVPLFWAMRAAGDRVGQSVYFAHEARIFRLLAEGSLHDERDVLRAVCHPEGHDASLYRYLARALAEGWDLETMFPGGGGFRGVFHHVINRQARRFDSIVAVGPLVRDELEVVLRPEPHPPVALCPNGVPSHTADVADVEAGRERLVAMAERHAGFRPLVIFTGAMRCELSKAPWRNVGLFRRFAERCPELPALLIWLSAPKPWPTGEQVKRWAREYGWPLAHRPASAGGDLRSDEEALGRAVADLNHRFAGQAALWYVNQFGWSRELLGALDPGDVTFADLRSAGDVELGLSVYEPFGIAPLEPFASGAVCVLSDACGSARWMEELGLAEHVVVAGFGRHDRDPAEVDAAVLREIETHVYDQVIDELVVRLGFADGVPARAQSRKAAWRRARAARIAAAQAVVDRLSWRAAVEEALLPALEG
ncbi:MAG: hypothetical protein HYU66_23495 [Armatimonadetes bacterium]|nr:hypothetical protein [Armatimonadota bacterium]